MTDAEIYTQTAGLLTGILPAEAAERFRARLRESEPLRDRARQVAWSLLLAEHSEAQALLQQMAEWETHIAAEQPADTDTARIGLLLNEHQAETELLRNMETWESEQPRPTSRRHWRKAIWLVALLLLFVSLAVWRYTQVPSPPTPAQPSNEIPSNPKPPNQKPPNQKPSNSQNQPRHIAFARDLYRQSGISSDYLRSAGAEAPDTLRRLALDAYENRRWPAAIRALDSLLPGLADTERPDFLLLLGGACFEQGAYGRAASIFAQRSLKNDPVLGPDAQRYELLSRLAAWPADSNALHQLIRVVRRDPGNPNRGLAVEVSQRLYSPVE